MNTRNYMIIIKGEIKTSEIMSCVYNKVTQKWDVKFKTQKTYSYAYLNVEKLTDPVVLDPDMYRISREGREFFDIKAIYVFRSRCEAYWHICFGDGSERDYRQSDLHIIESYLNQSKSSNVFEYIKQIAGLSDIKNAETGEKLLFKRFDKQEKLAYLRQEISHLVTEQEYFNQYVQGSDVNTENIKFKKKLFSKHWMELWQECQLISEEKKAIGFWFKIKALLKYGVADWSFYKPEIWHVTPDATPDNIIDIMKKNGFKDLSEGAPDPEPTMLLNKNDFVPYEEISSPVICSIWLKLMGLPFRRVRQS